MNRSNRRNSRDLLSEMEILMITAAKNADETNYQITHLKNMNQEYKEISTDLIRQLDQIKNINANNKIGRAHV